MLHAVQPVDQQLTAKSNYLSKRNVVAGWFWADWPTGRLSIMT